MNRSIRNGWKLYWLTVFEHSLWSVIGLLQGMLETDITELNEGNHYNKTQAHKQQPPPPQRISESIVAIRYYLKCPILNKII